MTHTTHKKNADMYRAKTKLVSGINDTSLPYTQRRKLIRDAILLYEKWNAIKEADYATSELVNLTSNQ
jgi:hypothetical protein